MIDFANEKHSEAEPVTYRHAHVRQWFSWNIREKLPVRFQKEIAAMAEGACVDLERLAKWYFVDNCLKQNCSGFMCVPQRHYMQIPIRMISSCGDLSAHIERVIASTASSSVMPSVS